MFRPSDNVHYQQTAQMVRSLTDAEVPFRIQVGRDYTNQTLSLQVLKHD